MFGIKILRERDYNRLVERVVMAVSSEKDLDDVAKKNAKDCEGLRQQNSELRKEINKLREENAELLHKEIRKGRKVDTLRNDTGLTIANPEKCELCKHEHKDCRKVIIDNKTICIVPIK